jgi:uncharacterized membrane protein YgcG
MRSLSATRPPRGLRALLAAGLVLGLVLPASAAAEGPPFPDPVEGQAVYDEAEVLRPATEARAEEIIDAIEERTGAEIAVYTQLVPYHVTFDQAEDHAIALMDQWGVGRRGIDDGLVILFDLHDWDPCHGQVQLYAGPGYRATYLSNGDRQDIFDNDMLPLLERCDLDGALLVALAKIDANATPEHAATLAFFRGLNAVLGLIVAPIVLVLLAGWGLFSWLRFGRDPIYLDDPSIHIPAAPKGLTPAAGALVRDGTTSRRGLTAAMLDLASRNHLGFEPEKSGLLGLGGTKITIQMEVPDPEDPVELARLERIRRRPVDPATSYLHGKLTSIGGEAGEITPTEMLKLGSSVGTFDRRLEEHVVRQGWFRERPAEARNRWIARGVFALFAGIGVIFIGANLPSDGLLLVGVAAAVAGVVLMILAQAMPARPMPGAMIRAMLEAYRRTLEKTMAQARSMDQVVAEAALPILEEPDDAVAWGVALGLQGEVEEVLKRTADDLEEGRVTGVYVPRWYGGWSTSSAGREGGGGWAPGLMSSSAIPNFGGMMAALSTIGNSPSSSGSGGGGGGGFSGGSSGGGGGGAGGGF